MTETSLCHSMTTFSDRTKTFKQAFESVGRPIPFTESKIVDPITGITYFILTLFFFNEFNFSFNLKKGQTVPLNMDGELYVRGVHVFKGLLIFICLHEIIYLNYF